MSLTKFVERKKLHFPNDQDRLKFVLDILNTSADPFTLLCSESKSLNAERLETATEKDMQQFLEDAHSFASSFTVIKKQEADHEMTDLSESGTKHLMIMN